MNSATTERQSVTRFQLGALAVPLGALWFLLCRQLSGEWSVNEQYSYGWFVPFFAAFLFWLRWEDRPGESGGQRAEIRDRRGVAIGIAVVALVVLLPVRLFEVANPDWRPLSWVHAAAVVAVTLVVLWFAGGTEWVGHFAFPVCFIFVAVPWITPIEEPIVQGLMRTVAALATETITLFGIPAQVEGNLIRVSTGLVGVNEACSGVRSLQTSLMIGLLFGELKRLSVARRCLLVVGALAIALVANFGRALFLVWIAATKDVAAVESWHDVAGYVIVAVVFLGSVGLAQILDRDKVESRKAKVEKRESAVGRSFSIPALYFLLCCAWVLGVEGGVEAWYRTNERELVSVVGWDIRPPPTAPGFREIKIDENVRRNLQFDAGREVMWKTASENSPGASITNYLFFFRWDAGSSSVLRARAHRPDICLPSAGWTLLADRGTRMYSTGDGIPIAARHVIFGRERGGVAHTFFCLQEDKVRPAESTANEQVAAGVEPAWSVSARVRMVRHGIRNPGQRVLEAVLISGSQMEDEAAETRFGQLVREAVIADEKSRKKDLESRKR